MITASLVIYKTKHEELHNILTCCVNSIIDKVYIPSFYRFLFLISFCPISMCKDRRAFSPIRQSLFLPICGL